MIFKTVCFVVKSNEFINIIRFWGVEPHDILQPELTHQNKLQF